MARIAFIGAGSLGFTRGLARDILTFPLLKDSTLVLMDVDKDRLSFAQRAVQAIVDKGNYPAKVEATMDRAKALKGADAVLSTILAGGFNVWKHDILIPKKYGVDTNIGDTRGPSGIFRALRTIPVMLDICRDIERYAPNAIFLNYTNPMAMLCRAMQRESSVQVSGLCHSVQGTANMLARWIKTPMDRITYVCAGINHLAWYVEFKKDGKDAYPLLRKAMNRKAVYNEEIVRNEMFLNLGYYVTESSGHNSEYNWWFRKRPDLIEKYCTHGTGWNPGVYAYILEGYGKRQRTWKRETEKWLKAGAPISLERGHEYAANIINAYMGGKQYLVQRQRAQHRPGRQPAGPRLRGGARAGQPPRAEPDPRRRAAAAVRHPDQRQLHGRGDGRRGRNHRRPDAGLPGHRPRPADGGRALAGRDQADGQGDAAEEQVAPAAVQEHQDLTLRRKHTSRTGRGTAEQRWEIAWGLSPRLAVGPLGAP